MKKIQTITLISLLVLCFCFAQCHKEIKTPSPDNPYGLPNATQNGANNFACLINGQKFIAYYDGLHSKAGFDGQLSDKGFFYDTLGITGSPKISNYFEGIGLSINGRLNPNSEYIINTKDAIAIFGTDSTCLGISSIVTTAYAISGTIHLTKFDTTKKIVSGVFNCIIPIPNCDTLNITEGRFDYQYH